jgi:hypothetical protein
MAVEVAGYRRRRRGEDAKRAAKAKREKILLAALVPILIAIGALEGPKTLKKLHGSSVPATPAIAPATSSSSTSGASAAPARKVADLSRLSKLAAKDPFDAQIGATPAAGASPTLASPPAVRTSHLVAKDPFVQQLTLAPAPAPAASAPSTAKPTTTKASTAAGSGKDVSSRTGNYIVILASIPLSDGRAVAGSAAAAARSHGVNAVKIVDSTKYPTLRTGFYAVYSGPYATLPELESALEQIRGKGYLSAYTRRLAH